MMIRSRTCLRRWQAATLIEVLAGLAILGSVTVTLLLARGNLLEQHRTAQLKLEGIRVADQLLVGWYAADISIPHDEEGEVEGHPGWSWRTRTVDQPPLLNAGDPLPAGIIRLELFSSNSLIPQEPIVTVDLLAPVNLDAQAAGESA